MPRGLKWGPSEGGAADQRKNDLSDTVHQEPICGTIFYVFQLNEFVNELVLLKKLFIIKLKIYHDIFE